MFDQRRIQFDVVWFGVWNMTLIQRQKNYPDNRKDTDTTFFKQTFRNNFPNFENVCAPFLHFKKMNVKFGFLAKRYYH